jgi:hypothetical protein
MLGGGWSQHPSVTLSGVGQQSPPSPSAAHTACALHACASDSDGGGEMGEQQPSVTSSAVGQQSPCNPSVAHAA